MLGQEHTEDNMILSGITGFVLGCGITILYLKNKFITVKALLEDKLLINDILKKEINSLTCCKEDNSKKAASKPRRRTYKKKSDKQ